MAVHLSRRWRKYRYGLLAAVALMVYVFFLLGKDVQLTIAIVAVPVICWGWYIFAKWCALRLRHGRRGTTLMYRATVALLPIAGWALVVTQHIDPYALTPQASWKVTVWFVAIAGSLSTVGAVLGDFQNTTTKQEDLPAQHEQETADTTDSQEL